jgi:hypothetical protein
MSIRPSLSKVPRDPADIDRCGGDRAGAVYDGACHFVQLRFAVAGSHKKPETRRSLGHGRVEDRRCVDTVCEESGGEASGADRAAGDDRHDRRANRAARIEAAFT